jgi:hypothetical protein
MTGLSGVTDPIPIIILTVVDSGYDGDMRRSFAG